MNNSMISAMVSMSGIQQRLDLLADNIANMDNTGYKRKEASFEDTLTRIQQQTSKMKLSGRATPSGFDMGFGSRMSSITSNLSQGSIKETDNPTDLAIEGNALFVVRDPKSNNTAYTRAGDFHIQPDPENPENTFLVNKQGYQVLNSDGDPIEIPAGAELQIDGQGNIRAVSGNVVEELGMIQLMTPIRPEALEQIDGNLFVLAGGAVETDVLAETMTLLPNQQSQIRQRALEGSNVNLTDEMAEMMQVQRAYQLAARALSSSDTMMNLANNLRG